LLWAYTLCGYYPAHPTGGEKNGDDCYQPLDYLCDGLAFHSISHQVWGWGSNKYNQLGNVDSPNGVVAYPTLLFDTKKEGIRIAEVRQPLSWDEIIDSSSTNN